MKTVIALWGPHNAGKSATINTVYEHLRAKYPKAPVTHETINHDVRAILTINGHRIGLESQGDPASRMFTSISMFAREECDIIVCATRTRGHTVKAIEDLEPKYKVTWIEKNRESNPAKYKNANDICGLGHSGED